jgi:transposase
MARRTAGLLMTHPGVGPITALATDVFLGDPKRFRDDKALASYIGIIPRDNSSGGRQRLGGLTKQGNLRGSKWPAREFGALPGAGSFRIDCVTMRVGCGCKIY